MPRPSTNGFTKDGLTKLADGKAMTVKFRKANGDIRVMKCTLDTSLMPKSNKPDAVKKPTDPSILKVVSLDGDTPQWRSIKLESIISVQYGGYNDSH